MATRSNYTADKNAKGTHRFTHRAKDSSGETDTAEVRIQIKDQQETTERRFVATAARAKGGAACIYDPPAPGGRRPTRDHATERLETRIDDERFDSLARAISGATSRRKIARVMLAAALAGVVGRLESQEAAAACCQIGRRCGRGDRCCGGARCKAKRCRCPHGEVECGGRCVNLLTDSANCGQCGLRCASGECLHGTCTCDPFNNQCPTEVDGQCTCGAVTGPTFRAARVDRNSACDLSKPCDSNADCPPRSVCLKGCSDPPDPQPNRCSKPCNPV